jgi:outer membrane receptor protein involved in Fe transport
MHAPTLILRLTTRTASHLRMAGLLAVFALAASAAEAVKKNYHVPAGDAASTLKQFTEQSGEQVVYLVNQVRGVATKPVKGELTARAALDRMLDGTGLVVFQDEKTGALTVRKGAADPNGSRAAPVATSARPSVNGYAATADGETVELSPFRVNTDKETGFGASSSLAGGRLATDLRDTPVPYSVITREFIDTLKLTDLQAAQNWATGSTFQSDIGTNYFITTTTRYNTRGVTAGQQMRNFFPANTDIDSYSLDRYEFGRGPNSILFGNGSVGGVSSATTKRARTDRPFQDVDLTAGCWSLLRATIDLNQPISSKLAMRVAGVGHTVLGWREKQFDKRRGVFVTTTARPMRDTELRVDAEAFNRYLNAPINNLQDQLSGWDGKTTFARPAALNGASSASLTALQAQGVARRPANYNVFDPYSGLGMIVNYANDPITVGGGTTAATPIAGFTYGSSPAFGLTGANLVEALNVPDRRFEVVEASSYFRRPSRRFSINQDDPLVQSKFRGVQATLEQRVGDFFFEVAGDINKNAYYVNGEQNRGANITYIDLDSVLPNGAPNPHFLQAYGDGNIFREYRHYDFYNWRAAAAWCKDTRLGRFAVNTMIGENRSHYTLSYQWLSLAQGTNTLGWIDGTTATIKVRRYWNEPHRPFIDLAGHPISYLDPNTQTTVTVTPRWVIDHTRFDTESINDANYRYGFIAMNARLWHDRLILLGAFRRDQYYTNSQQMAVSGDYPTDRDPLVPLFKPNAPKDYGALTYVPLDPQDRPLAPAPATVRPRLTGGARDPRYAQYRFQDDYNAPALRGYINTQSAGAVVHLARWLNPTVNYAETFNPQKAYTALQGGGFVPPNVSKGWNYGTRFELFDRKLDVNFSYYTSVERNNAQGVSVSSFPFNKLLMARPTGSDVEMNKRGVPVLSTGSDLRDRDARGYELELTASLVRGLRVIGSAALPKVYDTNPYQITRAYIEKNAELFKLIAQDAGVKIDAANVATVDPSIPAAQLSPNAQDAADAYNQIFTSYNNLNLARSLTVNQPLYKVFGDYTFQSGRMKGVRLGLGVLYRGRERIGNRGADTIVDPNNPARAIDDPTRDVNTPLMTPRGDYTVTATIGYLWRLDRHNVRIQLVINNLLNDRSLFWTTSTNGAAVTALRPRDGNYKSPARETVPVAFGLKDPISFNLSASWRM